MYIGGTRSSITMFRTLSVRSSLRIARSRLKAPFPKLTVGRVFFQKTSLWGQAPKPPP